MDTPSASHFKHRLMVFRRSVNETARHLSAPSDPGSWCSSAPFAEHCRVRELLHSSQFMPEEHTALMQEYSQIVQELDILLDRQGYRDILHAELRELVHRYHAETCFSHLCCESESTEFRRLRRELIGELLQHLSRHYSLSALEALVATVDENAALADSIVSEKIPPEDVSSKECLFASCSCNDSYLCGKTRPSARHV